MCTGPARYTAVVDGNTEVLDGSRQIITQDFFDAQSAAGTRLVKSAWLHEHDPDFPAGSLKTFYKQCTTWEDMQATQNVGH